MKVIRNAMQRGVDDGVFPGAVLLVAQKGEVLFSEAFGAASLLPKRPMTTQTVFDLASLTKPLATAPCLMVLIQQGEVALDGSLGSILSEFVNTNKKDVTVRQLLAHTSGLADYRPYFEKLKNLSAVEARDGLRKLLVEEPLVQRPGEGCLYSDLGFMILQWVVETAGKTSLDRFVKRSVFDPVGLESLFFVPLTDRGVPKHHSYAATEACPWRHKVLNGQVHDDNAYVVGGVAGHAGLFGTAQDVFGLLQHLLDVYAGKSTCRVFQRETVRTFFQRQTFSRLQSGRGHFALGFDTPTPPDSSSGRYFSDHSVGHLGFTGTSFWMDLDKEVIVILLTNRVHPTRSNEKIKAFRPLLHNTVMETILSLS